MKITKLGIGLVTAGDMKAQTVGCLITALQTVNFPIQVLLSMSCYIHWNRESVVKMAKENGCSHLLFIDSDMVFQMDAINKLAENDCDIVGARYNKRVFPIESTVKEEITETSPVHFVPTGFLLINMEVFDKVEAPYFSFEDNAESEDMYFCQKMIKNGYQIYCDPKIPIGHLGTAQF